jgi:HSP20 family protein
VELLVTFMHYEPFRALRELDRVTGQMLSGSRVPMSAPMDVWREGRTYHVELDLPGVAADDIDLQIDRNTLTVTAERRAEFDRAPEGDVSGEDREIVVAERQHGSFRRQLVLGEGLDTDGVRAQYTDGVLRLTIPLAEKSTPRRIDVTPGTAGTTGAAGTTGDTDASAEGDAQAPGAAI